MAADFDRRKSGRPVNPSRRWLVLALLVACTPEGSLGKDVVGGSSEGSTGGTTAHETTTSTSTHTHGSSEGSTTTQAADSGSGSSDTSSDSTGVASCEPTGSEDDCELCLKTNCCHEWQSCVADELCSCALDCVQGGGAVDSCTMTHCAGSTDAFMPELTCAHLHCMAHCPWAA
jgi:hypothetical protein